MKKTVLLAFVLVLLSTAVVVGFIRPAVAQGTIYIRADGSVDPPTAPISSVDNVTYVFTDNVYDSIVVERDNIVVDGAGYTVQGSSYRWSTSIGISLSGRSNVIIQNTNIKGFGEGVVVKGYYYGGGSNNVIQRNNITNNGFGISLSGRSKYNKIYGNSITNNSEGIRFIWTNKNNTVYGNNITNNDIGISLDGFITAGYREATENNRIYENNIANNTEAGVELGGCLNNIFYHNNILNNTIVIDTAISGDQDLQLAKNIWDNDYPYGGNYWSDYTGMDENGDGIGDTPFIINENNQDRYPLMNPWKPSEPVTLTSSEVQVGVKVGDWIKIDYTVTGVPSGTAYPDWLKVEILNVEGTTASVQVTLYMSDETEQSDTMNVDVATGSGTFDALFGFIIPANSKGGDSINMGGDGFTFTVTINGETTRTYAGASRTVVYASFSQFGAELTYYWDKQTGIMVEASTISGGMTATAKTTETNMWEASPPLFWMQWWFYAIVAVGIVVLAGAVYFLKKRKPPTPTAPPPPPEDTVQNIHHAYYCHSHQQTKTIKTILKYSYLFIN